MKSTCCASVMLLLSICCCPAVCADLTGSGSIYNYEAQQTYPMKAVLTPGGGANEYTITITITGVGHEPRWAGDKSAIGRAFTGPFSYAPATGKATGNVGKNPHGGTLYFYFTYANGVLSGEIPGGERLPPDQWPGTPLPRSVWPEYKIVTLTLDGNLGGGAGGGTAPAKAAPAEKEMPKALAHWKLDEVKDGKIADSSGNGYIGTLSGGMTAANLVDGKFSKALNFKGDGGYVRINGSENNPALNFAGKSFSIALWVNYTNASPGVIIAHGKGAHAGWYVREFMFQGGGVGGDLTMFLKNIPTGEWVHLAWTLDLASKTLTAYMNGKVANTVPGYALSDYQPANGDLILGSRANGLDLFFNGKLDDVRIYGQALTADQVKTLYTNTPDPAASAAAHGTTAANDSAGPIRVVCIGDSITYYPTPGNWPSALGPLLGSGYEVRNDAVSGTALLAHGDNPWINTPQYQDATSYNPNIVVIMLGTNDTKSQTFQHAKEFAGDYSALVDHFAGLPAAPAIYLCLPPPLANHNWSEANLKTLMLSIRQVAQAKKTGLIDIHSALENQPKLFEDGVHVTVPGAAVIAQTVYKTLKSNAGGTAANSAGANAKTPVITAMVKPGITSPLTAAGAVNRPFSYQIAASGNPKNYDALGLPAGLALNTGTGAITGTPTVAGDTQVTLSAANAQGTGTATLILTITAAAPAAGGSAPNSGPRMP